MKHGKKYGEAAKLVDRATQYDPAEAIGLVKKTNKRTGKRKRNNCNRMTSCRKNY